MEQLSFPFSATVAPGDRLILAAASLLPPHAETVQFDALGRIRAPFTLEPLPMFKLEIETGNAAFEEAVNEHVASLLHGVADKVDSGQCEGVVYDGNGNRVGVWSLTQ